MDATLASGGTAPTTAMVDDVRAHRCHLTTASTALTTATPGQEIRGQRCCRISFVVVCLTLAIRKLNEVQ
ncbi:hypothetical protein HBB16_17415, partial [Pseudonocardia sp. MCCB 268]|nr:hypothetical protein [Pseudonocardia cytotoxica]